MRILINHLTRMQKGCICAAGIELDSGRHVRPVLQRQLSTDLLASHGGPLELGRIVDLGAGRFFGRMPEIEDHLFELGQLQVIDDVSAEVFWKHLIGVAKTDLREIFGPDLQLYSGRTFVVPETFGLRSLGCYWASRARLVMQLRDNAPKIRFVFTSKGTDLNIPITDIRLFQSDHVTPSLDRVSEIDQMLSMQAETLVSIGLSRAYKLSSEEPALHWLQVNNIHFVDNPLWGTNRSPTEQYVPPSD